MNTQKSIVEILLTLDEIAPDTVEQIFIVLCAALNTNDARYKQNEAIFKLPYLLNESNAPTEQVEAIKQSLFEILQRNERAMAAKERRDKKRRSYLG